MSDPIAVLVEPAERDPAGLLDPAPLGLGGCPACVTEGPGGWVHGMRSSPTGEPRWALPLWWEGSLVPEGWDRLRRVMRAHALDQDPDAGQVRWAAAVAVKHAPGNACARVVLLDRIDGRLVERAP